MLGPPVGDWCAKHKCDHFGRVCEKCHEELEAELAKIDELVFDGMMNAEDAEHYIECHTEDLPKLVRAMAKVMYDLKAVSQPRIDKILDEMEERYANRKDTEEGK